MFLFLKQSQFSIAILNFTIERAKLLLFFELCKYTTPILQNFTRISSQKGVIRG